MRILIAQINPIIGDFKRNTEKILKSIKKGRQADADLVLFSELCLCGYPPQDFLLLPSFIDSVYHYLQIIVEECKEITAVIGLPRTNPDLKEKGLFNSAAIIQNQVLLGFQDKILLPNYDVFSERRYFEPGHSIKLWNLFGYQVAVTICEDIWQHSELVGYTSYRCDPIMELKPLHPDFVLNLSASPFSLGKPENRFKVGSRAAATLGCPLVLCNQVGGNDSLIFDGYSFYVNAAGDLQKYAKGFQEDFLCIDLKQTENPQKKFSSVSISDLYKALVLGVHDYFYKSKFKKACLGLSGGIDSALVACIAADALGADNVLGILMPSRYSSADSIEDAQQLVNNLKISSREISIENPFQSYLDLLAPEFAGLPEDTAEENLQARIRGMILMALSNKFGYVVLSTGNKSELAMGYATLYGDMCGGLGVISDVTKMQVYALSHWVNRSKDIIPKNILLKPPSAELRFNQKDSDSLPPYEIIDNVLQSYVEERKSPEEIMKAYGYPYDLVMDLIHRIHCNEYKRRQSSPGLRISGKSFSVGRVFPIVQGFVKSSSLR
jgi:NAD+ synthase (glutamine-hydrolysing)